MPICRNCKSRISKLDKDRCPICGEINPLDGVTSDTIEVTSDIDLSNEAFSDYKPKRRKTFLILSLVIGWTSAQFFYLKFFKLAFIALAINLAMAAAFFFPFFFGLHDVVLSIVAPICVLYGANIALGIYFYRRPTLKDAEGNLLK